MRKERVYDSPLYETAVVCFDLGTRDLVVMVGGEGWQVFE